MLSGCCRDVRGVWEAEASCLQHVIAAAVEASTTDNDQQTIGKTGARTLECCPNYSPLTPCLRALQSLPPLSCVLTTR